MRIRNLRSISSPLIVVLNSVLTLSVHGGPNHEDHRQYDECPKDVFHYFLAFTLLFFGVTLFSDFTVLAHSKKNVEC